MTDLREFSDNFQGKQVVISTMNGTVSGILTQHQTDPEGNITALVVRQYFHRTQVPAGDILNVRVI